MIVGGDRGDGGVIDQGVGGVVGAHRAGIDVPGGGDAAATQGGLSDHQDAARRLQHDYLPHPRGRVAPSCRSVLPAEFARERTLFPSAPVDDG